MSARATCPSVHTHPSTNWDQLPITPSPHDPITLVRPAQLRNHFLPVEGDERLLVAPDVVNVDLTEAEVDEMLQVVHVLLRVGSDQHPVLVVVGADELGHGLEIFRLADVALR